jgi:hypothetical protein
MNNVLGDFNIKADIEDIFKPTIGKENLHEISQDIRVIAVNVAKSKNLSQIQSSHIATSRAADCDTGHCLVMANVRERLAVNKQTSYTFHMEMFNLGKLNEVEGKEKYHSEVSISFAALENWFWGGY